MIMQQALHLLNGKQGSILQLPDGEYPDLLVKDLATQRALTMALSCFVRGLLSGVTMILPSV